MENPVLTKQLSRLGRFGRSIIKRFIYSQMVVFSGLKIAFGKDQPLVQFTVEADPPSIYWVYRIKSSEVDTLLQKLGISSQFSISPIKCLNTDEPSYFLALNAYRVSGLVKGVRAEWSIFIKDSSNTPRYMIVDARSSNTSMDPVDIITKASTVIHKRDGNVIHTQIGEGEHAFVSTITLAENLPSVHSSAEWVSANDYIYWMNGVCDRTFYNAGLADTKQSLINNKDVVIKDGTFWAQFVEPEPVYILKLNNAIEFVVTPWHNVS
ncbi:MAG: hypothetical protein KF758_01015 [Anaerolineales bacterium]|nr:hypothetical protein [Anaerolineales bacterium]MBX3035465.1 hypothetical protein [Anaerolineales bacterium]